ncbi:DUF1569 domain-containing protein [Winogradskyella immobilis]|uniref:DUF1569 domain-containing protein n=1 Tax=Winogradskyella immobilis TaxID=2816852 RepID=A0ABS8EM53_9FLAO|nr:DUF1569 domain-containing protein [Winogradskyella immobilis]MCC1484298.1 DUF1569 domain-containing protein [Winogradskyella immobilis]MCG0016390.1 DUF1569 domain-containing protein [Winogradskyella immobilis]
MKNARKLSKYLDKIESVIPKHEEKNLNVSKSTVGWQIDHSLKVINNVTKALEDSDPNLYENDFSFTGKVFLTLGYFPRGKGKAPKHVKPPEVILKEDIISQLEAAKSNIEMIANLNEDSFFKHPLFGNINTKRIYRFLEVHTKHHLKIVNDILK